VRAILQKPNLVLLDEPTANLDPNTTEQVEEMIRQFDQNGADLLFSSHQLAQVQRLAEYILFIDQGEIKEKGPVGPFFSNPQTAAAKRYLHQELISE
jgi:tungstate transport system ATP-binding protein